MENKFQISHYKETSPENTVKTIKQILKGIGINVEETLQARDFGCHSVRVVVKDTNIGTNGKGVSKDYATASAYAEFMERLENNILHSSMLALESETLNNKPGTKQTWEKLVDEDSSFLNAFFNGCNVENLENTEKIKFLSSITRTESIPCDCYYSLKENRMVHVPVEMHHSFYASSGMCAGNDTEEALSQGISEIIERYVIRLLFESPSELPDIPLETMKKYPWVYNIYEKICANTDCECRMKDCSLGGIYPVAAFCMIEKNTGHFGIKFGSHPDIGIAMERTLTEAFQGRTDKQFAHTSGISFNNGLINTPANIFNCYKTSTARYPLNMVMKSSSPCNIEKASLEGVGNREILKAQLRDILSKGYDILVKDSSYLGFPAYSIIIPGMSESVKPDTLQVKGCNSRKYTISRLEHPEKISYREANAMALTLEFYKNSVLENTIPSFYEVPIEGYPFKGNENGLGIYFLLSILYFMLEDYENAFKRMETWMNFEKRVGNMNIEPVYRCVYKYLESRSFGNSHEKTIICLENFFDENIIEVMNNWFGDPEHILGKLYPIKLCNGAGTNMTKEICSKCTLKKYCKMDIVKTLWNNLQDGGTFDSHAKTYDLGMKLLSLING